ncbi:MAG: AraC family transcriptional regulator [Minicystis sp.]
MEDPRGDVLADVLGAARLTNVLYKRLDCRAPWGIRVPHREHAMFYLVARGTARLEVDGEAPIALSEGDVVFLPNGTPHTFRDSAATVPAHVCSEPHEGTRPRRLGGDGAASSIVAGFFDLGVGRHTALLGTLPCVVTLSAKDSAAGPWVSATVALIVAESASPGPASVLVLQRLADVLFVQALRSLSSHGDCAAHADRARSPLAALQDPHVGRALGAMHAKVAEPWTVESLAAKVGLSRSGFAARFAALVGEPPLQYLTRWRMARAAELLRDTNESMAEIAARVGYESVPSFSKAYKKWQGVSPGAFRRALHATAEAEG